MKALLSHGADVNSSNQISGATPLHSCVQSSKKPYMNRVECAKLIIQAGGDLMKRDYFNLNPAQALEADKEKTLLFDDEHHHYYVQMSQILKPSTILKNIVIERMDAMDYKGAIDRIKDVNNVNSIDSETGITPLLKAVHHLKIMYENEKMDESLPHLSNLILELLNQGADPNLIPSEIDRLKIFSPEGTQTPIHISCVLLSSCYATTTDNDVRKAFQEILERVSEALYQSGAIISSVTVQLMHTAAMKGHLETLRFWIDKLGVDPNTPGRQGLSCLHFASRSGKFHVAKWLVETNRVDLFAEDDKGKTALDAALANEKVDIISLLSEAMLNKNNLLPGMPVEDKSHNDK